MAIFHHPSLVENTFEPYLSLEKSDTTNLKPKGQLFQTILTWEDMLQARRPSTTCDVAQSGPFKKKKKNEWIERKIGCHIMHLKKSTKFKWKSRSKKKMCWENDEKLHKHKSFFFYKELLFSLGNCVWNEKWPSFTILSLMKKIIR